MSFFPKISSNEDLILVHNLNFERTKILTIFLSAISLILVIIDPFISNLNSFEESGLHYTHIYLFLTTFALAVIMLVFKRKDLGSIFAFSAAMIVAVNSVVVSGVFDMLLNRGIYVYIFTLLGVSVFLYLSLWRSIVFIAFSHISFLTLLFIFQNDQNQLVSQVMNSTIFAGVSFFFLLLSYKRKITELNQNNTIILQRNDLENKNNELVHINTELKIMNAEINQKKEEIHAQHDEIMAQRNLLAKQHKRMTDSINAAKRIQSAMLTDETIIKKVLPNSFIFFRPRDIVSGDFYIIRRKAHRVYVIAADCTGHGVPGAFMSVLGMTYVNEILNNADNHTTTSDIINNLRSHLMKSLHQKGKAGEIHDGMDISIVLLNFDTRIVQFSGANNSLILIRKKIENKDLNIVPLLENDEFSLYEMKADKIPIGISIQDDKKFSFSEMPFYINDCLYLYSDGFYSQFGGQNKQKYMLNNFRKYLLSIQNTSIFEQKQLLEFEFDKWMGSGAQMDDVLVLGVKI